MQNGGRVVTLSIATSESWKDDRSGERRERTEWHRVVIFNEGLGKIAEQFACQSRMKSTNKNLLTHFPQPPVSGTYSEHPVW